MTFEKATPLAQLIFDRFLQGARQPLPVAAVPAAAPPPRAASAQTATAAAAAAAVSKPRFTGLVVGTTPPWARITKGNAVSYSFQADQYDPKGRDQLVLAVLRSASPPGICNAISAYQRICHWFFWEGACKRKGCTYLHERPNDEQMRSGSMVHMIGKGSSACCTGANGPRGAVGT